MCVCSMLYMHQCSGLYSRSQTVMSWERDSMANSAESNAPPPTLEDERKLGGPRFCPPLYRQRYSAVVELARKLQAKRVLDMGCSGCKLLRQLKHEQFIEELVGVDIDAVVLYTCQNTIRPLTTDFLNPRQRPLVIKLMKGSIAEPDARLKDFDLIACVEVIEHLDLDVLERVPKAMFGMLRPKTVAMTTPNGEFNVLFPGFSGFRHPDHRFEWTRKEFQYWCLDICERYPYMVVFSGIGDPPLEKESVGCCSQMAVFTRIGSVTDTETVKVMSESIGTPYQIIAESAHPYEEHPLSLEEKLCHEAEYYLHVLLKQREEERDDFFQDEPSVSMGGDPSGPDTTANIRQPESDTCVLIGLEGLLTFPRIKNLCSSVDEIRSALQLSQTIQIDTTGVCAVFHPETLESDSDHSLTEDDTDPNCDQKTPTPTHPFLAEPEEIWD